MSDTIKPVLVAYLNRKTVPEKRLRDAQAQADEVRALLQALHRASPVRNATAEWAEDFLAMLERREKAPVWPSVADIERLAAERRKEAPSDRDTAEVLRGAALFAKRMRNREPVAESDLWGPVALEAWREHGIRPEDITALRAASVEAWAAFYGREAADKWREEQERRWADAKAAYAKPTGKTVSAERRAELVAWAREVVEWGRIEDATAEPFHALPDPDELERARAANPIVRAIRAQQEEHAR